MAIIDFTYYKYFHEKFSFYYENDGPFPIKSQVSHLIEVFTVHIFNGVSYFIFKPKIYLFSFMKQFYIKLKVAKRFYDNFKDTINIRFNMEFFIKIIYIFVFTCIYTK